MFGRLAMGFANVRAGTPVLMLVLVQAAPRLGNCAATPDKPNIVWFLTGELTFKRLLFQQQQNALATATACPGLLRLRTSTALRVRAA